MTNNEIMKLNLTRHEVCQIRLGLTGLISEMKSELNNENTTDDRKDVLISSINMWETLKSKICNQFKMQDI